MTRATTKSGDHIRACIDRGLNFAHAAGSHYRRHNLDTSQVAYVTARIFLVRCVRKNHVYTRCGRCFRAWVRVKPLSQ